MVLVKNDLRIKWYNRSICTLLYINFDGLYIIMNRSLCTIIIIYARISFCTKIRLHVYHLSWPRRAAGDAEICFNFQWFSFLLSAKSWTYLKWFSSSPSYRNGAARQNTNILWFYRRQSSPEFGCCCWMPKCVGCKGSPRIVYNGYTKKERKKHMFA